MDGLEASKAALLRSHVALVTREDGTGITEDKCRDIVSSISVLGLLREAGSGQGAGSSAAAREQLKQAVDQWCSGLQRLASKTSLAPQRAAHAATLLGATSTACDAPRLLQSYTAWATPLLDMLKRERDALLQGKGGAGSAAAVQAACLSLAQLFQRLRDYAEVPGSGVKRDASAQASRATGLLLPLLQVPSSPEAPPVPAACTAAALQLLQASLAALPTSMRGHLPALEPALAGVITAPGSPAVVRAAAGRCQAALPRVVGDAVAHSEAFRRLLLSAHDVLDSLFMGLEADDMRTGMGMGGGGGGASAVQHRAMGGGASGAGQGAGSSQWREGLEMGSSQAPAAAEASGAEQTATPTGGLLPAASIPQVSKAGAAAVKLLVEVFGALLSAMEQLLTSSFPVPVPLPCAGLLKLVTRVVRFSDAAVLASGRVPPSSSGFTQLQASVPALHEAAWGLLALALRASGASMAPHHAASARLLAEHLRRVRALGPGALAGVPASVRAALYGAARAACDAPVGGLGAARIISAQALGAATVELYGWACAGGGAQGSGPGAGAVGVALMNAAAKSPYQQPQAKKAKLLEAHESAEAAAAAAATAAAAAGPAGVIAAGSAELAAQVAALSLLGAVTEAAAPLLAPAQRAELDALAFHIASAAQEAEVHAMHEPGAVSGAQAQGLASLQTAAYRVLLSTLLAPCSHRPQFLSQASLLFAKGKASSSPSVRAVSCEACCQLEGLLHPRALPITGVVQAYAGTEELQPLPRPRLWSALDRAPAFAPPAQTAAHVQAHSNQAPQTAHPQATHQHPQQPEPAHFGASKADGAQAGAGTAWGSPTASWLPSAAPQQQAAASGAHRNAAAPPAPVTVTAAGAAQQQQGQAVQQVSQPSAVPSPQYQAAPQPAAAPAAAVAAPAPAQPAAPAAAAARAAAAAAAAESSDSEGSLPDIDSGSDEDEGDSSGDSD